MAKQSSASPAAAAVEGPAPSRVSVPPQPQAQSHEPIVIDWSNDAQDDGMDTAGAEQLVVNPDTGKAAPVKNGVKPKPAAPQAKEEKSLAEQVVDAQEEPPGEEKPKPEPEQPKPAERRRDALRALEQERRARSMEDALKAEQTALAAERAEHAKLQAAVKSGKLSEFLALRGMSRADLEDMIIKGDKELEDVPREVAKESPDLAELKSQLKTLTDRLAERDKADGQMQIERAIAQVADMTKDLDIPVTRAVDGGHELVMQTALQMWKDEGKARALSEYVPEAAERAEGYFRKQKPGLAKLADAARGKAPAEPVAATRSIGRRTAARPDATKPRSVWEPGEDGQPRSREEVDILIKKEMGLFDRS